MMRQNFTKPGKQGTRMVLTDSDGTLKKTLGV